MKLENIFCLTLLTAMTCIGPAASAAEGIVIHCSDQKGDTLVVDGQSAFEFAVSPGAASYNGKNPSGESGIASIEMGCEIKNPGSSYGPDLDFTNPQIKCSNALMMSDTPQAILYRSQPGKPLIAKIQSVAYGRPQEPSAVAELTCDK